MRASGRRPAAADRHGALVGRLSLYVGLVGSALCFASGCGQLSAAPAGGGQGSTELAAPPKSGALGDNYVTVTPAEVRNGSLIVNVVLDTPSATDQAVLCSSAILVVGSGAGTKPARCVWQRVSAQGAEGSLSFGVPASLKSFRLALRGGSGAFSASWTTQTFFAQVS